MRPGSLLVHCSGKPQKYLMREAAVQELGLQRAAQVRTA